MSRLPSRWSSNRLPVLAGAWLLALSGTSADRINHHTVRQLRASGEIISLGAILQDARRRYDDGRILEAELEQKDGRLIYEIEFLDRHGELRELYYDAKTGELLAYEVYQTGADGTLLSIKYDAKTGAPVAYEVDVIDENGERRRREYDMDTGELLREEDD